MTAIPVSRLNHAVLYVRDVDRAVDFYTVGLRLRGRFAHRRLSPRSCVPVAATTTTTWACSPLVRRRHDRRAASTGLYHLAWEVPSDRGPGHCRRGVARRRRAGRRQRPRRQQVALRRATRTAMSSRSCGAFRATQWGDMETDAGISAARHRGRGGKARHRERGPGDRLDHRTSVRAAGCPYEQVHGKHNRSPGTVWVWPSLVSRGAEPRTRDPGLRAAVARRACARSDVGSADATRSSTSTTARTCSTSHTSYVGEWRADETLEQLADEGSRHRRRHPERAGRAT